MSPIHRASPTEYSPRRRQRFGVDFYESAMTGLFTPVATTLPVRAVAEFVLEAPCKPRHARLTKCLPR